MKKITLKKELTEKENRKILVDEINKMITDDVKEIVTNGNLAATMQQLSGYSLNNIETVKLEKDSGGKAKNYSMGSFSKKQLLVDPYMSWGVNIILFDGVEKIEIIDESGFLI